MPDTLALLKTRFKEVADDKGKQEAALAKLQEKLRDSPGNLALRTQVQEAKEAIRQVCNEYGDLARAVSSMQGGTNYTPAP